MFYLVRLDRDADGNLVETPLPDCGTFDKGADAAKASKTVAAQSGLKVQCRRLAQAGDWRAAMQKRLDSGELTLLPKSWDLEPIKDHFAHLWASDPSKIAFIESEDHGIIQKLTALTPGRYITRFYETEYCKMKDDRRRKLIAAIDPSGEVFYATTPSEIEYVYRNGPESCMDGEHDFDELPMWPTAPYGAGDLAVAYTKNHRGRIQSRALCWPEKKIHGRCYGDVQRMKAAMAAEGYTYLRNDGDGKEETFVGARLLKVPTGNGENQFVVPYFDDINVAIDMGDHFVTAVAGEAGKEWVASGSSSGGCSYLLTMCPKAGMAVMVNETIYVHGADQKWCRSAVREHAFTCEGSGQIWSNNHKVVLGYGRLWSTAWFDQYGEHCVFTKSNWPKSEMVQKGDKRMHRSVADRYDADGKELAPEPKRRGRPKPFNGLDLGGKDRTAVIGRSADMFIVDEAELLNPLHPSVNDLILSRNRRVA